jgi:hypothetical protein
MKRIKVLIDFIRLSIAEKIVFYRNAIARLKANATIFAKPDEDLETVITLINELEAASLAAADGSHSAILAMRAAENAADEAFRVLAAYVDRIAKGDEAIIAISGFNASKQPNSIQKAELTVVSGANSGSAKLMAKAIAKAGSYIWQHAKDNLPTDDSSWTTAGITTQATNEISGLAVASRYFFRVAAVTPDGTSDFCGPVQKVIE